MLGQPAHPSLVLVVLLAACLPPLPTGNGAPGDNSAPDSNADTAGKDTAPPTDADGDGYSPPEDCDDANADVNPGAAEACNGEDDDCDGVQDDGVQSAFYDDADGDGYGDPNQEHDACESESGWVTEAGDCDDTDPGVHPGAGDEAGDGIDQDCDGTDAFGSSTGTETLWGENMLTVAPGTFCMGCSNGDRAGYATDHEVTLTHEFWLSETEVTQAQWASWTAAQPSTAPSYHADCPDCPVEVVSWYNVAMYANALSDAEGLEECYNSDGSSLASGLGGDPYACDGYRLPTEAEWEYAARAGEDTVYSGSDTLEDVAWNYYASPGVTHEVATKMANAWGFYDMSGNVDEWVYDWVSADYSAEDVTDPSGPTSGSSRGLRGGGITDGDLNLEVGCRNNATPGASSSGLGFRLARTAP